MPSRQTAFWGLIVATAGLSVSGCSGADARYKPDQIVIEHVARGADGSIAFSFQAMPESQFYCPGIKVQSDTSRINVIVLRRNVADSPGVEVRAGRVENPAGLPVFVVGDGVDVELWPTTKLKMSTASTNDITPVPLKDLGTTP